MWPTGEIVAEAARGTMMGNRGGCFHDAEQKLTARRWTSRRWICCRLEFKGWYRPVMQPRRYTELFFLDEATALAVGHRPCAMCRHEDYVGFAGAWARANGLAAAPSADAMDRLLHEERVESRTKEQKRRPTVLAELPVGSAVQVGKDVVVRAGTGWRLWNSGGYRSAEVPAHGLLFTPPSIVAVLRAGYRPQFHPSADG
ncbi:MAG: hypothetical protein U1E45_17285 [Geminicoccaceae bacterium]